MVTKMIYINTDVKEVNHIKSGSKVQTNHLLTGEKWKLLG